MNYNNYLKITIGPMFSGKTTTLIKDYKTIINERKKCLIVNSCQDTRMNNYKITNHNKEIFLDCIKIKKISDFITNYQNEINNTNAILIDEAQFFEDIELIINLFSIKNKLFIGIYGLDGDSNQNVFGNIYKLIPHCDNIIKLNGFCSICNKENKTIYSIRKDQRIISQVLIGDENMYFSICRNCKLKQ